MSRSTRPIVPVFVLLLLIVFNSGLRAGTTSWSYSTYTNGGYVPKIGNFTEVIASGAQYQSTTSFRFDSYNVGQILDYNDGGNNPGSRCDFGHAYVTIDQTVVPNSHPEKLDADLIVSTLPNPKYDIEDDEGDGFFEESEVVALGTVNSTSTFMVRTYWNDFRSRTGKTSDGGTLQVQFAMSIRGVHDYNNCITAGAIQIQNPYAGKRGSL